MSKTDHLAKAKEFIAKGEDYYRKAAEEIVAAKKADPGLTNGTIAAELGRDESWVRKLTAWVGNSAPAPSPFARGENDHRDASAARKIIRERPEVIAEAISEAPKEVQAKIADELIKAPETERSLRSVVKRSSEPSTLPLPKAERKLGDGVFRLWEAGELLLDETPSGEERIRMAAMAEKAQRLAAGILHLLGTGELEDEFQKLIEEVRADA